MSVLELLELLEMHIVGEKAEGIGGLVESLGLPTPARSPAFASGFCVLV